MIIVGTAYLKYISSLLLFGSNGIISGFINMNSYEIVTLRTMIGSFALLVFFRISGSRAVFRNHMRQFASICASGAAMGVSWLFLYEAYTSIGVGKASLCYYCGPIIVVALSPVLFGEVLSAARMASFAAVLCGMWLVNGDVLSSGGSTWGIFCGIMSAVMYAVMLVLNKRAADITGFENAVIQLCASFAATAAFSALLLDIDMRPVGGDILPLLILGVVNTGLGCYLYFSSIGYLSVQSIAVCGYLEPISAVVMSVIFMSEPMNVRQAVGAALVIGGALFGELADMRAQRS